MAFGARTGRSRRRYGAVLVLVLVVLAMLSLLAFGLCHRVRLELKMARMASDELRAYYLAMGGVRRALVAIRQDKDNKLDHFQEPWRLAANAVDEGLLAVPEDGSGREVGPLPHLAYVVSDEEGRLNINTSSPAGWACLPGVSEPLIYAIVDWQDEDQAPTRDGAESDYYQREVYAHASKDAATTMVWELALIRDVSWWGLLGEDVNGNGVLDDVEDDGPTRWPLDNADGRLDRGLADLFTVYGDGKVNLNTASYEVLSALPDIGPQGAGAVVSWRWGADGQPFTGDDRHFESLDQVRTVSGITERQAELLNEYGTLVSKHFRIVVEAGIGGDGKRLRLMAIARRDDGDVRLVYVRGLAR